MVHHPLGKPFQPLWIHPNTQASGDELQSALTGPRAKGMECGLCDELWQFVTNLYRKTRGPETLRTSQPCLRPAESCILGGSATGRRRVRGGKDYFGLEEGPWGSSGPF